MPWARPSLAVVADSPGPLGTGRPLDPGPHWEKMAAVLTSLLCEQCLWNASRRLSSQLGGRRLGVFFL